MSYLLYCVIGYSDFDKAKKKEHGYLCWFNPRMICTVKSFASDKLAKIQMTADTDSFWCDLGGWESIIDEIHANYCRPKDVRIQEVVVTK